MKKVLKCRVLPVILVFLCSISLLVVPAFAADFPSEFRDYDAVDDWNAKLLTSNSMGLNALAQATGFPATANEIFWALVNGQVSNKVGEVNRSELEILASTYTAFFTSTIGETFGEQIKNSFGDVFNDILARTLIGNWDPYFEVQQHPSSGLYRIKEMTTGLFVVDSAGRYPYAEASSEGFLGTDQWVPISAMDGGSFRMLSKEAIYNLADDVGGTAYTRGNYICIAKNTSSGVVDKMVLANEDGKPYVCWKDKNQSATEQERPTTNVTENGNIVEGDDNSVNLDLEGMTMLLPGGTLAFIDQIIYDESTKSYHIDSHDTYNTTVNNYYTWNYYINYTSITYIGQTEEYNKYYEVYYELPDGRSSADLTKEDLEQLNLSIDVIPYGRSADDTSLRSLYHFDGDTKDSSYWNYCTNFKWNKGASLTYMDAGVFEGALYLDETEHDFTFTLPSNLGSSDFTIQWRYYQSATAAPQTDSYIQLGSFTVMQFNGAHLFNSSGSTLSAVPIGSWNEIALIRSSGILYYYLNGVCIGSVGFTNALSNRITFHFGSAQQTFKYFDELRVLNYPLAFGGAYYSCSSVPHDTNLSLVLPDSTVPIADEYYKWTTETQPKLLYNFETTNLDFVLRTVIPNSTTYKVDIGFYANSPSYSVSYDLSDSGLMMSRVAGGSGNKDFGGLYFNLLNMVNQSQVLTNPSTAKFYFYFDDYKSYSATVTIKSSSSGVKFTVSQSDVFPSNVSFGLIDDKYLMLRPSTDGGNLLLKRIELRTDGSSPSVAEKISSITLMDKADLHTPTLAVRTDIDIDPSFGDVVYQIGGVRPSIPMKGMVWAMVENERITSLQVYNGQAWEGVDGRIWTGERWVPYSSFNIITLQDLYDIVDATPNYEYIYSESGFWSWWQKSWNAFTEKLFAALGSNGVGSGGVTLNPDTAPVVPDDEATGEKGYSILELLVVLKDGTWSIVRGVVSTAYDGFSGFVTTVSNAGSFFDSYSEDSEGSLVFIPLGEGETIWD